MEGIITGRVIGKNKDGDINKILLQIQCLDEDVRTVEMRSQHGEDVNPSNGCRVTFDDNKQISIVITDDLESEVAIGEKELYSTDNPATTKMARIKLAGSGDIILNQGTESSVKYSELETAFNQLKDDFDDFKANHKHGGVTVGGGVTAVSDMPLPSTADITPAESDTVKVP
jgi:hypothetical protein